MIYQVVPPSLGNPWHFYFDAFEVFSSNVLVVTLLFLAPTLVKGSVKVSVLGQSYSENNLLNDVLAYSSKRELNRAVADLAKPN